MLAKELRFMLLLFSAMSSVQGSFVANAGGKSSRCLGATTAWDHVISPVSSETSPNRCLGCHDGTIASNVTLQSNVSPSGDTLRKMDGQHPIDVSYSQAFLLAPAQFQHPSMVDHRVSLPMGKVQCVSCHDFSSQEKAMLVFSNKHSELCLACHKK